MLTKVLIGPSFQVRVYKTVLDILFDHAHALLPELADGAKHGHS